MQQCAAAQSRWRGTCANHRAAAPTEIAAANPKIGQAPAARAYDGKAAEHAGCVPQQCSKNGIRCIVQPGDRRRHETHPGKCDQQAAPWIAHEQRCRHRPAQCSKVIGGSPFRAGRRVQRAVAQHERQHRREGKTPDAHGDRQRDGADADDHQIARNPRHARSGHGEAEKTDAIRDAGFVMLWRPGS